MAIVDGSLGSLVQGVSQQPARARLPGQSEEQENIVNDEVFGTSRRQSTVVRAVLEPFGADMEHGVLHTEISELPYVLSMDDTNPSMKIIEPNAVHDVIIDPLSLPYMQSYVGVSEYGSRIQFKELDGNLFVLNTAKTVAMLPDTPTYSASKSTIVYCRGGQYAVGFTIRFEVEGAATDHQITYCPPNGAASEDTEKGQVKYIVQQLYKLATEAPVGTSGTSADEPEIVPASDNSWVPSEGKYYASSGARDFIFANFFVTMVGEYLIFYPTNSATEYTITATETSGSDLLIAIKDDVDDVGKLPTRAPHGHVVRIVGSNRSEDDYFLQWVVDGGLTDTIEDKDGYWEECTAPDEPFTLDPATLPQRLYWDGTDYRIEPNDWPERSAGSNDSNPIPEFVGDTIQDLGDFQGRAVFIHGTSVSMSQSDEYYSWFKQTASTKLATDPIHLRSTSTKGNSRLIYLVPYNRDLIIIGTNNAQFILEGRSTVTTDTAAITVTSEFDIDLNTRPRVTGEGIMFLSYTGKYVQAHEMFLSGNDNQHERRTITDHVPRYIAGSPNLLAASDGVNTAMIVAEDRKVVYLYEYLWLDGSRVQSSWNKWTFPAEVVNCYISEGVAHITFRTSIGSIIVTEMTLYREDAPNLDHAIHLDFETSYTLDNERVLNVPYSGYEGDLENIVVVQISDGSYVDGDLLPTDRVVHHTSVGGDLDFAVVTLSEAMSGRVVVGTLFKTKIVPTMPYLKDRDGVAISGAEIGISDFVITVTDSGPFDMIRRCNYEDPDDYWRLRYSARTLSDPDFVLGTAPVDSGKVQFPFEDQNTTSSLVLECSTHLPLTITEIEWYGNVRNRYKRLTNGG